MKTSALFLSLILMALASPALAQGKSRPQGQGAATAKPEDPRKKKAEEDAYQRALQSIPEPKGKIDPWSGAR